MKMLKPAISALITGLIFTAPQAFALGEMPRLQFVSGEVHAISPDGVERPVKKGDILKPGEKLVTAEGSMAQLRLFGQGIVALREASEVKISPPVNGRFDVALDKGLIRTVTALPKVDGQINIATRRAVFSVKGGDMQTANKLQGQSGGPLNLAISGVVKVSSPGQEVLVDPGTAIRVNPLDGSFAKLTTIPTELVLKLPSTTAFTPTTSRSFDSNTTLDTSKLNTPLKTLATAPTLEPVKLSAPLIREPVLNKSYTFELSKVAVGTGNTLDGASKTALNDSFVLILGSSTSKTPTVQPITTTTSPALKTTLTQLSTKTTVVDGKAGSTTAFVIKDPVFSPKLRLSSGAVSSGSLFFRP